MTRHGWFTILPPEFSLLIRGEQTVLVVTGRFLYAGLKLLEADFFLFKI